MVKLIDSDGSGDFISNFQSVAQQHKEEEELRQNKMFLQILNEVESPSNDDNNHHKHKHYNTSRENHTGYISQHKHHKKYNNYYYDDYEEEYNHDEQLFKEFIQFKRMKQHSIRNKPMNRKEHLKVSISDDDDEYEKKKRDKEKREYNEKRKRIHTLDDLPNTEYDFLFGGGNNLDMNPPELKIETGRRLQDGEHVYTASLPGWFDNIDLSSWFANIEILILIGVIILLLGIYIGRRTYKSLYKKTINNNQQQQQKMLQPQIIYAYPPPSIVQQQPFQQIQQPIQQPIQSQVQTQVQPNTITHQVPIISQ